jgi:hypothetical protein
MNINDTAALNPPHRLRPRQHKASASLDEKPSLRGGKTTAGTRTSFMRTGNLLHTDAMVAVDTWRTPMNIVVIGGSGLIGSKLVKNLRERGHDVLAASPSTGVNSITREGLAQAMDGADIVVDVANAPSWEDQAVLEFFERPAANLLAAEAAAGVRHHVALSIVGTERLPENGYFGPRLRRKALSRLRHSYSILRATQFFEFVGAIADRLPSARNFMCRQR